MRKIRTIIGAIILAFGALAGRLATMFVMHRVSACLGLPVVRDDSGNDVLKVLPSCVTISVLFQTTGIQPIEISTVTLCIYRIYSLTLIERTFRII